MTIQGYPLCLALRRAVRKGAWTHLQYRLLGGAWYKLPRFFLAKDVPWLRPGQSVRKPT